MRRFASFVLSTTVALALAAPAQVASVEYGRSPAGKSSPKKKLKNGRSLNGTSLNGPAVQDPAIAGTGGMIAVAIDLTDGRSIENGWDAE